ncbi:MAG TPA: AAA family ATPase [Methanocella sp.]|nr:AAA family ATPase [Methanocella sp.]
MTDSDFNRQLEIYLRSRFTLIVVITGEEERLVSKIRDICDRGNRSCYDWDVADGFKCISGSPLLKDKSPDPLSALMTMEKSESNTVYILKDYHEFWGNVEVKRKLRNLAQKFRFERKSIVIITPVAKIPDELSDEAVIVRFRPPEMEELEAELDRLLQGGNIKSSLTMLGKEKFIQASLGMTLNQSRRAFAKAIVTHGSLDDQDIQKIVEDKKAIISQSEALEFYSAVETPDNVGGLKVLKEWLKLRERAFTQEARDFGLPAPKGIALIGIPGTGKSLTAKMIAGLWRLPLLRLDVGALYGNLVGESEERTRKALSLAETIAPCILWIDEIEKAFSFGGGDGGTSHRVFGTMLTWMQDKTVPCFVVATANNIDMLPTELLRKGRFDEIFFLDLPVSDERKEIFSIHLKKHKCLPQDFDLDCLTRESEGYVGAEIEQTVVEAMYQAFNQDMRKVTTEDILKCLKQQVPLAISQRETVDTLRRWLKDGRAISASKPEDIAPAYQNKVQLDLFYS